MRLSEILIVPDQSDRTLRDYIPHIINEVLMGKSEKFNVFKGDINQTPGYYAYVARQYTGEFMGYVIGRDVNLVGKRCTCLW